MNLSQHPEYDKYNADKEIMRSVQEKLPPWFLNNEGTGEALETAVFQLTALFQEYNQSMWQEFSFCKMCLGGCCVVGASEVTTMDAAVLTTLGHDLPILSAQTHHNERACIYLGENGCSWPENWRPLKCMIFYSLGSGKWKLRSSDERYGRLTIALQAIVDKLLPKILDANNGMEMVELAEPIGFAAALSSQLAHQLLPEEMWIVNGRLPHLPIDAATIALLAIAKLTEQVLTDSPDMMDQVLADLEQFEWVVTGHPSRENELLTEMNGRYITHTHKHPTYLQFTQDIQQYQQSTFIHMENS